MKFQSRSAFKFLLSTHFFNALFCKFCKFISSFFQLYSPLRSKFHQMLTSFNLIRAILCSSKVALSVSDDEMFAVTGCPQYHSIICSQSSRQPWCCCGSRDSNRVRNRNYIVVLSSELILKLGYFSNITLCNHWWEKFSIINSDILTLSLLNF